MKAKKWNVEFNEYEHYNLPRLANRHEVDMTMIIQCASCSEPTIFGNSYSSRKIHDRYGLAYFVCESCHKKELVEELNSKKLTHDDIPF